MTASVTLWWVLAGVPLILGFVVLVGNAAVAASAWGSCLWVVLGAVNLRAGFRGPRYVLTVTGAVVVLLALASIRDLVAFHGAQSWPLVLVMIVVAGLAVPATVLMWMPAAGRYIQQSRQHPRRSGGQR